MFFFFFSCRRRHTISYGDWSSDVCSSDLAEVFERLRAWRAATAKEQGVPAYVIFHDATLREVAARCPATLAELVTVSGVGGSKLAKYGQQVLDTLDGLGPEPAALVPPE